MRGTNQVLMGILVAFLSAAIVLGSLLLSLVEGGQDLALIPSHNPTPTPLLMTLPPGAPTYTPSVTPSLTPTETAAPPANCNDVPPGWQAVVIQPDETLSTIAARYGISEQALRQGNCLATTTDLLNPGSFIFVPAQAASPTPLPPIPTLTLRPTRTTPPCGPPPGWTIYRVRPGDTLFGLSIRLGVSEQAIQAANCMGNKVNLYAGQPLWVPFIPIAPILPPTWTRTLPPPTFTVTPLPPTWTPTRTPPPPTNTRPAPTSTRVPPTNTPLPPTATPLPPTNTPLPPTATPPPPTNTPLPPTATPLPPTDTPLPPTDTSPPPTNTSVPPTNTSAPPPVNTQAPSTATSAPANTPPAPLPIGSGSSFASAAAGEQFHFKVPGWPASTLANQLSRITFVVIN